MKDKKSEERINKLHPLVRTTFKKFIEDCETLSEETTLRITQGLRTFEEQRNLYNQGRISEGKIVTNAKAGQSFHNYGLAIDLVELDGEHNEIADWKFDMGTLKIIADKYDIIWGGQFRSIKDPPHFEISFGYTWQELLKLYNDKKVDTEGYVLIKDKTTT